MNDECAPGDHVFGDPGPWEHYSGTGSTYRKRECVNCGHGEIEGRGVWDARDDMDPSEVLVIGGNLDRSQTLIEALNELRGIKE